MFLKKGERLSLKFERSALNDLCPGAQWVFISGLLVCTCTFVIVVYSILLGPHNINLFRCIVTTTTTTYLAPGVPYLTTCVT